MSNLPTIWRERASDLFEVMTPLQVMDRLVVEYYQSGGTAVARKGAG